MQQQRGDLNISMGVFIAGAYLPLFSTPLLPHAPLFAAKVSMRGTLEVRSECGRSGDVDGCCTTCWLHHSGNFYVSRMTAEEEEWNENIILNDAETLAFCGMISFHYPKWRPTEYEWWWPLNVVNKTSLSMQQDTYKARNKSLQNIARQDPGRARQKS